MFKVIINYYSNSLHCYVQLYCINVDKRSKGQIVSY